MKKILQLLFVNIIISLLCVYKIYSQQLILAEALNSYNNIFTKNENNLNSKIIASKILNGERESGKNINSTNSSVTEEWVARYNYTNEADQATSMAIDGSGNIYVTGNSYRSGYSDYATVKYNSSSVEQWSQRYTGPGIWIAYATCIAVDGSGNVYVTGYSSTNWNYYVHGYDFATIKYNSSGIEQWVQRYNGPGNDDDIAYSIAVDGSGYVYVTGLSNNTGTGNDFATIKYNPDGTPSPTWPTNGFGDGVRRFNGMGNGDDVSYSLAVDGSGNVYVTGYSNSSNNDYTTIKYNSSGVEQWVQLYNGPGNGADVANSVQVDVSGNVYVSGYSSGNSTGDDYATIKYASNGTPSSTWPSTGGFGNGVRRYNGPGNGSDGASKITVDGSGNVYVTGYSPGSGTSNDYATIKYNSSGSEEWIQRYNGPVNRDDNASSIAVDCSGNVYVTGSSGVFVGPYGDVYVDYATIKYNSSGVQQWVQGYNGYAIFNDWASSIAVDCSGNTYVTGGAFSNGAYTDYTTIKYKAGPPEDVNSDGIVDADDLAISLVESTNFCDTGCLADVNSDTITDLTDIIIIFNYITSHISA